MKNVAAHACVMVISALGLLASQAVGQESNRKDFEEFCKINEGRWTCNITWVENWPGVGKKGETVRVYSHSTISEDGNALIEKTFIDKATTTRITAYDAGSKRIKGMEVSSSGYVAQYTVYKDGGVWKIDAAGSEADGSKSRAAVKMEVSDDGDTHIISGTVWWDEKEIDIPGDVWRRVWPTGSNNQQQKVLLFLRDGSMDLEYMLKNEAGVMKMSLENAGFKVEIATPTGETISAGSVKLKPDLKITDVSVRQYSGFILPCMAVDDSKTQPSKEAVKMVKKAIAAGKPVAAQLGSVRTLAKAGLLKGKKYASVFEFQDPYFEGSIRSGRGIVSDGNIITSGICPYMAKDQQNKDGTKDLVSALISAIKNKTD